MTLIQRLFGVQHLRPQKSLLGSVRVIGIHLLLLAMPVCPVVLILIFVLIGAAALQVLQISETEAAHKLTVAVSLARAPAAETILSRLDALAEHHAVDEAKVGRDDGPILRVDDGDGGVCVRGKGAELAKVT
jgi:hypothetical protein